jgi:Domain of unknown function (DUF2357)
MEMHMGNSEIPKLPDTNQFDDISMNTEEKAWWTSFQVIEHLWNEVVTRDPITNEVLPELLSNYAERLVKVQSKNSYQYNDYLYQWMTYSQKALKHISKHPRSKMVKEPELVHLYKVSTMTNKTMNWLGKQPGRTMREKISSKNKLLSEVKHYSYNTKENQVAAWVMNRFHNLLQKRLEKREEDGTLSVIAQNMEDFMRIVRKARQNQFHDVMPLSHNQPNNILISDPDYSQVWRTFHALLNYPHYLEERWNHLLERYLFTVIFSLIAELNSDNRYRLMDEYITLQDHKGQIQFMSLLNNKAVPLLLIHQEKQRLSTLQFEINKHKITVHRTIYRCENGKYISSDHSIHSFRFHRLDSKHGTIHGGIPLRCINEQSLNQYIEIKADLNGFSKIIQFFLKSLNITPRLGTSEDMMKAKQVASLDFMTHTPQLSGQYTRTINNFYVAKRNWEGQDYYFHPKKQYVYATVGSTYAMMDILGELNKENSRAFHHSLSTIQANLVLNREDHFLYTVPDGRDEFSLRNLKLGVKANFKQAYPVWRSIAGAQFVKENLHQFNDGDTILVIDTHDEYPTMVKLKVLNNKVIHDTIFLHYPPYDSTYEGESFNYRCFMMDYLYELNLKYNWELTKQEATSILNSGALNRTIFEKYEELVVLERDNKRNYILLRYEEGLYYKVLQNTGFKFRNYLYELKNLNHKDTNFISSCIVISDYLKPHKSYEQVFLQQFTNFKNSFFVNSSQLVEGIKTFHHRLQQNLPTWSEYLPKLSLEVIKDGHYDELSLIKERAIENMGSVIQFEVDEVLFLKKGQPEYQFPLIKHVSGKNNQEYQAKIRHESFPLKKDILVKLSISYQYGYNNSYELVLSPVHQDEAPFQKITADWIEEEAEITINPYPKIPIISYDEERKLTEKDLILRYLRGVEITIDRARANKNYERFNIEMMVKDININMNRLHRIMGMDETFAYSIIAELNSRRLMDFFDQMIGLTPGTLREEIINKFGEEKFKKLENSILQFYSSFGKTIRPEVVDFIFTHQNYYTSRYIGRMLAFNGKDDGIVAKAIDYFKDYRNRMNFIRSLTASVVVDPQLIINLQEKYPVFIESIIHELDKEFQKIYRLNLDVIPKVAFKYRDCGEVLFAILTLRSLESFGLLRAGSPQCLKLAKCVRKVESMIDKSYNEKEIHTRYKFSDLQKDHSLIHMNDLFYVLNIFLTGDSSANLVQITDIELDEN